MAREPLLAGYTKLEREAFNIVFEGCEPVQDAKSPLTIFVNKDDVQNGVPTSFTHCAIANATQHAIGEGTPVMIMRSIAIVGIPNEAGQIVPNRFTIPIHTRNMIYNNDRGLQDKFNIPLTLNPPSPSDRLDVRKERARLSRERRAALIASGQALPVKPSTASKSRLAKDPDIRNGTGLGSSCRV